MTKQVKHERRNPIRESGYRKAGKYPAGSRDPIPEKPEIPREELGGNASKSGELTKTNCYNCAHGTKGYCDLDHSYLYYTGDPEALEFWGDTKPEKCSDWIHKSIKIRDEGKGSHEKRTEKDSEKWWDSLSKQGKKDAIKDFEERYGVWVETIE